MDDTRWISHVCQPVYDKEGQPIGRRGSNRDITDRKRAEEELNASRMSFTAIVENSSDGIVVVDEEGRILYANPSTSSLFGVESESLVGRKFGEPLANGARFEIDVIRTGGQIGIAEMRVARTNWDFNPAWLVLLRDVTERNQAQEELRQSEFRLNRAEVLAGTGNWEIDLSTKRVTASDGAKRIYGVGKEELTLDDIQKYPLSEYRSSLDAELNALVRDGALYDIEFKIKRANDDQVVAIHSIAHYDPEKNSVFGTIHDITDLRHAEQNHRLLFEAINQSVDATIITDSTGVIQYVNPAQEMLSGYSLDELVGQTPNVFKSDFQNDNSYKQLSEDHWSLERHGQAGLSTREKMGQNITKTPPSLLFTTSQGS